LQQIKRPLTSRPKIQRNHGIEFLTIQDIEKRSKDKQSEGLSKKGKETMDKIQ